MPNPWPWYLNSIADAAASAALKLRFRLSFVKRQTYLRLQLGYLKDIGIDLRVWLIC